MKRKSTSASSSSPIEIKTDADFGKKQKLVTEIDVELKKTETKKWLSAVNASFRGVDDKPLQILLSSSSKDPTKIDWNATLPAQLYQGITLANVAVQLYYKDQGGLLQFLLSTPKESWCLIDWNAGSQHPLYRNCGITLSWWALHLALCHQPALSKIFLSLLAENPEIANSIKWDACPAATHEYRGITLAWLAVRMAARGMSASLNVLLKLETRVLCSLDWNATPRDDTLFTAGITLAWFVASMAEQNEYRLLQLLLTLPQEILKTLDWNAGPLNDKNLRKGSTLAVIAAELATRDHPELLNSLLLSPISILKSLDWNKAIDNSPLIVKAVQLASQNHFGLLELLLIKLPRNILKDVWNKLDNNHSNLFGLMLSLISKKMPSAAFKNLIQPEILATIIWHRPLQELFSSLVEQNILDLDEALAQLPIETLTSLRENFKNGPENAWWDYLNFLINIYQNPTATAQTNAFGEIYSLKFITGYRNISLEKPSYPLAQLELINCYQMKSALTRAELERSVFPNLEAIIPDFCEEEKGQDNQYFKLVNILYHQCHYYYFEGRYDDVTFLNESKSAPDMQLISQTVNRISKEFDLSEQQLCPKGVDETEIFLKKLWSCPPHRETIDLTIQYFLRGLCMKRLENQIKELEKSVKVNVEPSSSPSSSLSLG